MTAEVIWWLALLALTGGPLSLILLRHPPARQRLRDLARARHIGGGSGVEVFLGSMALFWGVTIANPWGNPLAGSPVFQHLLAMAAPVVWGTLTAALGAAQIGWYLIGRQRWRSLGAIGAAAWWAFLAVEVTWGALPVVAPATPIYVWFGVWSLWLAFVRDPL